MPTYDYKCKACDHELEIFHSMTEVRRKCPACGKNALERLIGAGGAIIFKGSGFYQTDYRSESYKKAAASENGAKSEAKGESKTDAKAETKPAETKTAKTDPKADKPVKKAG